MANGASIQMMSPCEHLLGIDDEFTSDAVRR